MMIKVTVEHAIKPGQEKQALEAVKNLRCHAMRHSTDVALTDGPPDDHSRITGRADSISDHLPLFSQLTSLSRMPAKIRLHLVACA